MVSEEQKIDNVKKVLALVEKFPEPRKSLIKEMLEGPIGSRYFTAPASQRTQYHSAFPGGLVYHSLLVVANLWRLAKDLCPDKYPNHVLSFVGLFHDLGKAGDESGDMYVVNGSQWHRDRGMMYELNNDIMYMEHSERSAFLLQKYGVTMEDYEYISIRIHDGQYIDANKMYKMKEPDLALFLHWADLYAVRTEKNEV